MRASPYAVLQIDVDDHTQVMSETRENADQKDTRGAECALLALGMALLTLRGAARVESIINSRAALGKFDAFESRASVSADSADSTHERGLETNSQ
jgi:hypothetical protein